MSEMELHMMRNRLEHGRNSKASRGELFHSVPMGYVVLPTGEVDFDPDEQARDVIHLIFDKFEEIGSIHGLFHWLIQHDIQLPIRPRGGPRKGHLEWRRPSISVLAQVMHHPIYAGAYSYGRRRNDPKRSFSPSGAYRQRVPMEQWKVLLKDHLPAYITWDQYLKNRERISQNLNRPGSVGTPRTGAALLTGILVCGCGRAMQPSYHSNNTTQYGCRRHQSEATELRCYGLAARVIDTLVAQQALRALEPAALELSLQAGADLDRERQRLDKHWMQRLKRARYDAELAEQRYQAVDPNNRLVAASLEKRWEELLGQQQRLQEEYDRFARVVPQAMSEQEHARISALATDIPTLWHAASTSNIDRKQIIRCLVERVTVDVRCDSELVDVTIRWAGGYESRHEIVRPVATYAQLSDYQRLLDRLVELREAGRTATEIASILNAEGFHPPKANHGFSAKNVRELLECRGLIGNERTHDEPLHEHEWWLMDLARELKMSHLKLREWANRGWLRSRRTPVQGYWILWADKDEVHRLRQLLAESHRGVNAYSSKLKTPNK